MQCYASRRAPHACPSPTPLHTHPIPLNARGPTQALGVTVLAPVQLFQLISGQGVPPGDGDGGAAGGLGIGILAGAGAGGAIAIAVLAYLVWKCKKHSMRQHQVDLEKYERRNLEMTMSQADIMSAARSQALSERKSRRSERTPVKSKGVGAKLLTPKKKSPPGAPEAPFESARVCAGSDRSTDPGLI